MSKIGYCRVSTVDQDLDTEIEKLTAEGCGIIRGEKVNGASRDRDELATVLEFLRSGDELVVTRLDRLGRSTRDVLNIVRKLDERGASLTVLDPAVSTNGDTGRVVLTVLGMVAETERCFVKQRQADGIAKAKAKTGADKVYRGGKIRHDREAIAKLKAEGKGVTEIPRLMGMSRMQVYRVL